MPHREPFVDLIKEKLDVTNPIKGIEIGCSRGDCCSYLLKEIDTLTLVTIDPEPVWIVLIDNVKEYLNRLWILVLTSDEAIKVLKPEYDFVFIDGDHSYEQCKKDILNYTPLIKKGGIVAGHNYHKGPCKENNFCTSDSGHPGVHQSVDEIFGDKVKLIPDFTWYVQV